MYGSCTGHVLVTGKQVLSKGVENKYFRNGNHRRLQNDSTEYNVGFVFVWEVSYWVYPGPKLRSLRWVTSQASNDAVNGSIGMGELKV